MLRPHLQHAVREVNPQGASLEIALRDMPGKQIGAQLVRVPRGARGVGWALAVSRHHELPWWRVVAAQGRITSPDASLQYDLLCHEQVPMRAYLHVDIRRCEWLPSNL